MAVNRQRLPEWARKKLGHPGALHRTKKILRDRGLNTVCESARCPNIGECFTKPTATFLILGAVCTRTCGFCSVDKSGAPTALDANEPGKIAEAAVELGLKHVVLTSVTRDDLTDGGAGHFALSIKALKESLPGITVEVLTPDFQGVGKDLLTVLDAGPDIFNHNLETVPGLYSTVRPEADYLRSLAVIEEASRYGAEEGRSLKSKSGIMVGLGESADEVKQVLRDLHSSGCRSVTIGQYLQPTRSSLPVAEYVESEVFTEYEEFGLALGIESVYSGTFVRSSYNAELFK
ncbi:MAG: lipoyl synthase [Proteobacteria bacterium]|nr:lipoyl synthase [Pseudomonadota bacterium]